MATLNAIIAAAWNTIPHACSDMRMTAARAAHLSADVKLSMLHGYYIRAVAGRLACKHNAEQIESAIRALQG